MTCPSDNEIVAVSIKRLFGEHITSRLIRTQNRELSLGCIAYNMHRLTDLVFIVMAFLNLIFVEHVTYKAPEKLIINRRYMTIIFYCYHPYQHLIHELGFLL